MDYTSSIKFLLPIVLLSLLLISCASDEPKPIGSNKLFISGLEGTWKIENGINSSSTIFTITKERISWTDSLRNPENGTYCITRGQFNITVGRADTLFERKSQYYSYYIQSRYAGGKPFTLSDAFLRSLNYHVNVDIQSFGQLGLIIPEFPFWDVYNPTNEMVIGDCTYEGSIVPNLKPALFNAFETNYSQNPWPAVLSKTRDTLVFLNPYIDQPIIKIN